MNDNRIEPKPIEQNYRDRPALDGVRCPGCPYIEHRRRSFATVTGAEGKFYQLIWSPLAACFSREVARTWYEITTVSLCTRRIYVIERYDSTSVYS